MMRDAPEEDWEPGDHPFFVAFWVAVGFFAGCGFWTLFSVSLNWFPCWQIFR